MFLRVFLSLLIAMVFTSQALADFVRFDNVQSQTVTQALTYVESGLTFLMGAGSVNGAIVGGADGYLTAGTNSTPIIFNVTSAVPFDLISLDVEGIFRTWRIQSTQGGNVSPNTTGTLSFAGQPGWSGITSFSIIHSPGASNGTIRIDNINFTAVPEPSSIVLILLSSLGVQTIRLASMERLRTVLKKLVFSVRWVRYSVRSIAKSILCRTAFLPTWP